MALSSTDISRSCRLLTGGTGDDPSTMTLTGMANAVPLPDSVRVTVPRWVPVPNELAFTLSVSTTGPLAVEPDAGVTVSHGVLEETLAENARPDDPVLVIVTGSSVPTMSSNVTELGVAFKTALPVTLNDTGTSNGG